MFYQGQHFLQYINVSQEPIWTMRYYYDQDSKLSSHQNIESPQYNVALVFTRGN